MRPLTAREALLKVDWDASSPRLPRWFIVRRLARAGFRLVRWTERASPGGLGIHGVGRVAPRPETFAEVVALQLLLGSDPMREACNLRRARAIPRMPRWARAHVNVLYMKVEAAR